MQGIKMAAAWGWNQGFEKGRALFWLYKKGSKGRWCTKAILYKI
jgi:hypothetical protein